MALELKLLVCKEKQTPLFIWAVGSESKPKPRGKSYKKFPLNDEHSTICCYLNKQGLHTALINIGKILLYFWASDFRQPRTTTNTSHHLVSEFATSWPSAIHFKKKKKNKEMLHISDTTSMKFSSPIFKLVRLKGEAGIIDTSPLKTFHINKKIFISRIAQEQFSGCITVQLGTETKTVNLRKILWFIHRLWLELLKLSKICPWWWFCND